jgi:hypothetical protein
MRSSQNAWKAGSCNCAVRAGVTAVLRVMVAMPTSFYE